MTDPFTAWWVHAIAIWAWHVPFLFDRTLESDAVHTAQHLSFFLSGLLFWWALFYTHGGWVWRGSFLSFHDRRSHKHFGRAAYIRTARLVCRLHNNDRGVGADAA